MTQNNQIGAGGEEWLAMDETTGYSAATEADTILAAKGRIDGLRKRDVRLRLVDRRGQPLGHTQVAVQQTESAFLWGHNLWGVDTMKRQNMHEWDCMKAERKLMAHLLNSCSALHYWTERSRNDGPKSEEFQGYPTYDHLQWCVDWGNSEGLTVKGHPLFWTVPKAVPDWIQAYDSYDTRMSFLEVRIRSITNRFKGKIKIYDAINEPMWEPAFKDLPNRQWPNINAISDIADYCEPVLRWAREEDPDACYLINEYGVSLGDTEPCAVKGSDGSTVTPDSQFERYLQLLEELQQRGAAPDAVGLQGHTGGWGHHDRQVASYEAIRERTGLPVHITEFWAHTKHLKETGMSQADIEAAQAEYVLNCMTCAFGTEAVDAFFYWGMTKDLIEFRGQGWEKKALYHILEKQLHETWRTSETLTSDADGYIQFRGFHGDYALRLQPKGGTQTAGTPFTVPVGKTMLEQELLLSHRVS